MGPQYFGVCKCYIFYDTTDKYVSLPAIAVLFSERVEQVLAVKVLITAQCSAATLDIRKSHCETEAGVELFKAVMCCLFFPFSGSLTLPGFTIHILLLLVWPHIQAAGVNISFGFS